MTYEPHEDEAPATESKTTPTPTTQEIEDLLRRDVMSAAPGQDRAMAVNALVTFLEAKARQLTDD